LSLLVAANATDETRLRRMADRLDEFGASLVPRIVNGIALLALAGAAIAAGVSVRAASDWSGLAAATVAAAFAWAGFAKILRPSAWRRALGSYRLGALRPFTASIVPVFELAVPVLIAAGRIAAGSELALAMLGAFSLAVLRARRLSGDRLACGCFGRSRVRDYRAILARNAALAAIAVAAVAGRHAESTAALHRPGGAEILPAALAALGLVLTAAVGLAIARTLSPTDLGSSR